MGAALRRCVEGDPDAKRKKERSKMLEEAAKQVNDANVKLDQAQREYNGIETEIVACKMLMRKRARTKKDVKDLENLLMRRDAVQRRIDNENRYIGARTQLQHQFDSVERAKNMNDENKAMVKAMRTLGITPDEIDQTNEEMDDTTVNMSEITGAANAGLEAFTLVSESEVSDELDAILAEIDHDALNDTLLAAPVVPTQPGRVSSTASTPKSRVQEPRSNNSNNNNDDDEDGSVGMALLVTGSGLVTRKGDEKQGLLVDNNTRSDTQELSLL